MKMKTSTFWWLTAVTILPVLICLCANIISPPPPGRSIARYRTEGRIKAIQEGLEAYHAEHGDYPLCDNPTIGGEILYEELFGDHDGDGVTDAGKTCFMPDLDPARSKRPWAMPVESSFTIVDIWEEPIYYANYPEGSQFAPKGGGKYNSPGYDLWSLGNDPDPADGNQSKWIKNW